MAIQIRRGTDSGWESNNSNIVAGEPAVATDTERFFVGVDSGEYMELSNINLIAPQYDSSVSYSQGDYSVYQGRLYVCLENTTGTWDSSDWKSISLKEALDDLATRSVPTSVREAIYTLLNNAAYATTGLTDEIAVVQSWAGAVTSLTLSASSLSLSGSTPQTLIPTVVPSSASVSWSSSDNSIATVVGGVVTGVSNGSCVITATAGNLTATCSVTVSGFATLESISAVYTQSGTVYDTDSLDSLKADLVVTATYSDTSTATVPSDSYSLSGTLEVGTSTITVTYQGKTTTFTVTVTIDRVSRFGTFTDGYSCGKKLSSSQGSSSFPMYAVWNNSASARAAMTDAKPNNNYIITVTDSAKYNIAVYGLTSDVSTPTSWANAKTGKYYQGDTSTPSFSNTATITADYFLLSLKKMDNTSFTEAELANGAEAVFTFTEG